MRAMKDSGVEWIGEVPEEWDMNRLRYLASMESGATPSKDNLSFWEGTLPWVSSMEVKQSVLTDTTFHISEEAVKSCSTRLLPEGTLVMVVRSGILQHSIPVALLGRPMAINQDIKAFAFGDSMLAKYFLYFVEGNNDNLLKALLKDKSTVDNINQEYLKSLLVSVPPIEEQAAIVSFLDSYCGSIDGAVSILEIQISILERYRASVIHEAVTRGLDPSVPAKPSGVEWIGEIPEGWIIRKLKHIVHTFESGTSVRAASYPADGGEKGVLSLSAVFGGKYNPLANKKIDDDEYGRASCSVRSGCLLLSRCNTSEWVGLPAYVDTGSTSLYLPDKLWQIDFGSNILNKFVWYALRSKGSRDYCFVMSVGSSSSMQNISSDDLLNMYIPLPPLEGEMRGIVSFLDRKLSAIDAILDTKRKQLDILKRRRQSLIYEYVTGKRRVGEGN